MFANGTLLIDELVLPGNGLGILIDGSAGFQSSAIINHALMEKNDQYGLQVRSATVAVRNSVAAGHGTAGFHAQAFTGGAPADLSADHCQATDIGFGFLFRRW
ncbi:MAG: hypothetical protein DMF58_17650 [Acidobacteria bacterium]|nr:MAG: hypothetical protein DMF58_17650 [Acidobacteriota bacterium]